MKGDGSNPEQLTPSSEYNVGYLRMSPNGRYIVFNSWKSGTPHLWRMDADGSNQKQLTHSQYDVGCGDYTPGGEWVIYMKSGPEKGIWKVSIEGGEPVRLGEGSAYSPVVSPDGKLIAYEDDSEGHPHRVAIMPFAGGPPIKIFDVAINAIRWNRDGREILYSKTDAGVDNIWSQAVSGGKPKQITRFTSEQIIDFDVSPDGSQLVLTRGRSESDVMLMREVR